MPTSESDRESFEEEGAEEEVEEAEEEEDEEEEEGADDGDGDGEEEEDEIEEEEEVEGEEEEEGDGDGDEENAEKEEEEEGGEEDKVEIHEKEEEEEGDDDEENAEKEEEKGGEEDKAETQEKEEEEEGDGGEENAEKEEEEEGGEDDKAEKQEKEESDGGQAAIPMEDGPGPGEENASIEDSQGVKSSNVQVHGSHQSHLSSVSSIGDNNKVIGESMIGTTTGKLDSVLEVEVSQSQVRTELQMPEDSSLSSKHTPQRRPRSSSHGDTIQNLNKKPAIICDFFARGWCIRGNSCRFLHQKNGSEDLDQKYGSRVDLNQIDGSEEDHTASSKKVDVMDVTGTVEGTESSKAMSSHELPDSSNTQSSSKSQIDIQRSLVRQYGGQSDGSAHTNNDYKSHIGEEADRADIHQGGKKFLQEEYRTPFGVHPHFDPNNDGRPSYEHLLSTRYINEGKLQMDMPRMEFLNDSSFPGGSTLAKDSLVAEKGHYLGGQSSSSSIYNSNFPLAYDKRSEDRPRDQRSNFPLHGSYSSYSLTGSLQSNFNSSLQTPSLSASHSASLPSSSPYYSRPEITSTAPHTISGDHPTSVGKKTLIQEYSWEPSVPFRPSFPYPLPSLSSSGNQYDPLLDSIEPLNTGNINLQASRRYINQTVPSHSGDSLLNERHVAGMQRPLSSFPQPYQGTLGKSSPPNGLGTPTAVPTAAGPNTVDGGKGSMAKEEKLGSPGHIVESTDVHDAEVGGDPSNQADKGRTVKESKAVKIFRAALVEFVKELVKPSWREGHLSKDAHKSVVKKAVEKVLNALQPHQVPSTTESIDQYLSISRTKILKLVEGYVEKYSKSSINT